MANYKNIKIVLAEDDFLVSEETSRILKELGFNVLGIAPNGEKAVEMAQKLKPDVMIMDIQMPKMNGLDAALKIQQTSPTAVVLLTAHDSIEYVHEASDNGVGAYLTKPPDPKELERAIYIALSRFNDLQELMKLNEELKKTNFVKDRLFSIIAHDLKNPFQALMGLSEIIIEDIETLNHDEIKETLGSILEVSQGAYKLFENLLNWSRLLTKKIEPDFELWKIDEALNRIIDLCYITAKNKGVSIELNLPPNPVEVFADKNMIETAVRNLVNNAVKFTNKDGKIIVSVEDKDSGIIISVEDTGVGIDEKRLSHLLDGMINESTYDTSNQKSTGLGVLVSNDFVKLNKGKMEVESKVNVGTKFTITLPKPR